MERHIRASPRLDFVADQMKQFTTIKFPEQPKIGNAEAQRPQRRSYRKNSATLRFKILRKTF